MCQARRMPEHATIRADYVPGWRRRHLSSCLPSVVVAYQLCPFAEVTEPFVRLTVPAMGLILRLPDYLSSLPYLDSYTIANGLLSPP
ncbi:hypothetical protein Tco_1102478 [Tanacetum coccineum]